MGSSRRNHKFCWGLAGKLTWTLQGFSQYFINGDSHPKSLLYTAAAVCFHISALLYLCSSKDIN